MIYAEIKLHTSDSLLQQWLDEDFSKLLDADEVVQPTQNLGMAAEVYLACAVGIDPMLHLYL